MKDVFAWLFVCWLFQGAVEDFHESGAIFGAAHFVFGRANGALDFFVGTVRELAMDVFNFVSFAGNAVSIL